MEGRERYWSKFAETHDSDTAYVVGINTIRVVEEMLSEVTNLGKVVEFGCGRGFYTRIIAEAAEKIIATDLSEEMLYQAKKELDKFQNVTVKKVDCKKTPFQDDSFDTVFTANMIHIIRNPLLTLKESSRILKRGGSLLIVTYTAYGMKTIDRLRLYRRFYQKFGIPPCYIRDFSQSHLDSIVKSVGFKIQKSELLRGDTNALFLRGINIK